MMRLTCPACGAVASIEAWQADVHARQTMAVIAGIPAPVTARALGYVAMFRPKGGRGLSWARAEKLAGELAAMVASGYIQWKQDPARPCPPRIWAEAIDRVQANATLRLPLDGHNYLRKIAYDLADEADRGAENERREADRYAWTRPRPDTAVQDTKGGAGGPEIPEEPLSPEEVRARIAALRGTIGKAM